MAMPRLVFHEARCMDTYWDYPQDKLDAIFDMKKRVCECIIADKGGNEFALPHRKKS